MNCFHFLFCFSAYTLATYIGEGGDLKSANFDPEEQLKSLIGNCRRDARKAQSSNPSTAQHGGRSSESLSSGEELSFDESGPSFQTTRLTPEEPAEDTNVLGGNTFGNNCSPGSFLPPPPGPIAGLNVPTPVYGVTDGPSHFDYYDPNRLAAI